MNAVTLIHDVFGGNTPEFPLSVHQVAARAAIVYAVGLIIVRYGKSRLISRATPLDVILGFILGSLLSRGITGHAAISDTAIASAVLVAMHWLFTALSCRSPVFEGLIKGHACRIIVAGHVQRENMLRSHVSFQDLQEAARLNGLRSLADIQEAVKERNGEISIVKKSATT